MSAAQLFSTKSRKSEAILNDGMGKGKGEKASNQVRDRVVAKITNKTPIAMTLLKSKSYVGSPETAFPEVIPPNEPVEFTHLSSGLFGSRGAVVYTGFNARAVPCAWLLGWDAPAMLSPQNPNRAYVDCGEKSVIDAIDWLQIESNIHIAPESNSDEDAATKTVVAAKFEDKIPGTASLEASFGLIPLK